MEIKSVKLDVDVKFTALDKRTGKVFVKKFREQGRHHFRIRIFLEGPDIENIEKVVYTLHPTFPKPSREITSGPPFELVIWAWGMFNLHVEIYDRTGSIDERNVFLDFFSDINAAKAKGLIYWQK